MLEANFLSLAQLIVAGQTVTALQCFYHPDVVVTEADGICRVGLKANIANEQKNLRAVTTMQAQMLGYAVNTATGKVFSEWQYLFTNLNGETLRLQEISVQEWENSYIKAERFYYKDFFSI